MEEKQKRKQNNQTKNCAPDLVLKGQVRGELSIFLHQSSSVGWHRSCSAGQAESTAETLSCGQGLSVLPLLAGRQITETSHWSGVNWKTRFAQCLSVVCPISLLFHRHLCRCISVVSVGRTKQARLRTSCVPCLLELLQEPESFPGFYRVVSSVTRGRNHPALVPWCDISC